MSGHRVKHYMGRWYSDKTSYESAKSKVEDLIHHNSVLIINREILEKGSDSSANNYMIPLLNTINQTNHPRINQDIAFIWGDNNCKASKDAVIAKTRVIGDDNTIILNINISRHWGEIKSVDRYDVPFDDKKDVLIWRGVSTGSEDRLGNRFDLVKRFHWYDESKINVGFSRIVQGKDNYRCYVKGNVSIMDQLKCKYIISVEGNDVATGLKWQLYSNSGVLMPRPTIESWAMESTLEPWVHYVPLEYNFSDLEEKYEWCRANPAQCKRISASATQFITRFMNHKTEQVIAKKIMNRYFDNIRIN